MPAVTSRTALSSSTSRIAAVRSAARLGGALDVGDGRAAAAAPAARGRKTWTEVPSPELGVDAHAAAGLLGEAEHLAEARGRSPCRPPWW